MEGPDELPARDPMRWPALVLLLVLAVVPFARIVEHDFVNWDDDLYVYDNPLDLADDGLQRIWTTLDAPNYYPLTYSAMYLQRALFGLDATGYHVVSLALHAANALLLLLLLLRVTRRHDVAWLAAALFAVHPLQVESVAWVTEQKNLLATLFALLAALSWLAWREQGSARRLAAVVICFAASLLSKTMTVTLPLALLAVELHQRRRLDRRAVLAAAGLLVMAVAAGVVTLIEEQALGAGLSRVAELGLVSRALVAGRALWTYPLTVLWPVHLAPVYPLWPVSPTRLLDWLPLLAAAVVLAALWVRRQHVDRTVLLGLALYALLVGPLLGLIPSSYMHLAVVADRYAYLPAVGLFLALTALLVQGRDALARRWPAVRRAAAALALAALAGLGAVSALQSGVWRDSETLWRHALALHPDSLVALTNLAEQLHTTGRRDEALALLERARAQAPDDPEVLVNLGVSYSARNRPAEAIPLFRRVLAQRPGQRLALINLGLALNALNRPAEAEPLLRQALAQRPEEALGQNALGLALALQGKAAAAIPHFRKAVALDRRMAEAHRNLAYALGQTGAPEAEVEKHFQAAAGINPRDRALWLNWSEIRARRGAAEAAREVLRRGLRFRPDDPQLRRRLEALEGDE